MSIGNFSAIRDLSDLAKNLDCSVEDLERFSLAADQSQFYTRIQIPKKGRKRRGQFRTVYKAQQDLGLLQKNIATALSSHTKFSEYVQGFVPGRSIATNARMHLAQKLLLHADLRNFFDSIKLPQVLETFTALGCGEQVALTLAKICTLKDFLPQGSSASPVLANLVCGHLDADLNTLASAHRCKYSRYADDITLSGDTLPSTSSIEVLIKKYGFELRDGKFRLQRRGRSQYVTGLTVFDSECPRIPRIVKRRLRLELYYAKRFGLEDHLEHVGLADSYLATNNRIEGWISFISSVEPDRAAIFDAQWKTILTKKKGEDGTEN